ncbi:hypothetical protein HanHA300_Chr09g0316321 [Helianthus annuus]|nr:hypothetical protein HanHA300_Chr09g0316321 [Helianthus annuus]
MFAITTPLLYFFIIIPSAFTHLRHHTITFTFPSPSPHLLHISATTSLLLHFAFFTHLQTHFRHPPQLLHISTILSIFYPTTSIFPKVLDFAFLPLALSLHFYTRSTLKNCNCNP